MNYAGFWRRFVAFFIDTVIVGIVNFVFQQFFYALKIGWLGILASLVVSIGYYVFYQQNIGQTIGKKTMKIKVIDAQGQTPSKVTFFLREIIGKFISGILFGIGYLWMLWDPKKQTLHDKIASTYVIRL